MGTFANSKDPETLLFSLYLGKKRSSDKRIQYVLKIMVLGIESLLQHSL